MGQSFGFDFRGQQTGSVANTGISKQDHPTADQVVGASAEERWALIQEREKVKTRVRAEGGHRALSRRDGASWTDYTAGGDKLIDTRKEARRKLDEAAQQGVPKINEEFQTALRKVR